jgi:hypothetical protein
VPCEVVPLDDVVDRADIVKVDVESYDWRAVQGMAGLIDSCRPVLVIAHHDFRHYKINDYPRIKRFLRERGYIEVLDLVDFIYEIPEHVLRPDEPEWVERPLRG